MSRGNRQRVVSAVALVSFYLFAWQIGAFGGHVRRVQQICAVPVVQAPLIKAAAFVYGQVPGQYLPAEQLQQQAAARFQMETTPPADLAAFQQWQQFQRYQAWAEQQQGQAVNSAWAAPTAPVTDAAPTANGPNPPPPRSAGQFPYAAALPTLVAKCANCHTGDNPNGPMDENGDVEPYWIDGSVDLRTAAIVVKRDRIVDSIVNGRMPRKPGTRDCAELSPDEVGAIIAELHSH